MEEDEHTKAEEVHERQEATEIEVDENFDSNVDTQFTQDERTTDKVLMALCYYSTSALNTKLYVVNDKMYVAYMLTQFVHLR